MAAHENSIAQWLDDQPFQLTGFVAEKRALLTSKTTQMER